MVHDFFDKCWRSGKLSKRQAQVLLAENIYNSLVDERISVVEGGTGVGKSYASIIGAICARDALIKRRIKAGDEEPSPVNIVWLFAFQS